MLGFLRAELLDLTVRDYNSYRYIFRLLLKAALRDYGLLGQLAVTEEFLILQILTEAQIDETQSIESRSHEHLRYRPEYSAIGAARFSAAASVMMLASLESANKEIALRALPHISKGVRSRIILTRIFARRARRALRALGFDPDCFDRFVAEELSLVQGENGGNDGPIAKLFGELFGFTAILARKDMNLRAARLLGEIVGSVIHKRLEINTTRSGENEQICDFLQQVKTDLVNALKDLEIRRYDGMIRNFLEVGLLGSMPEIAGHQSKGIRSLADVRLSGECNEDCSSCCGDNDASDCKNCPCHCG